LRHSYAPATPFPVRRDGFFYIVSDVSTRGTDLERQIGAFVDYYNNQRYHESLNNVTPADVYFGRDKAIIRERKKIKKLTIQKRRLQHQKQAA
jgi:hypothetical protein